MHTILRNLTGIFVAAGTLCSCGSFSDCNYEYPPLKQFDVDSIKPIMNSFYEFVQHDSVLEFSSRNELYIVANDGISVMPNLNTNTMTLRIDGVDYTPQRDFIPDVDPGWGECKHYVEYRGYFFSKSFLDSGFNVVFARSDSIEKTWDFQIIADTTMLPEISVDTLNRNVVVKSIFKNSDSAEYQFSRGPAWSIIDKWAERNNSDTFVFRIDSLRFERIVRGAPFYPKPKYPYSFCVESNQNVVSWEVNNVNNNGKFQLCRKIEGAALNLLLHWDSMLIKPED